MPASAQAPRADSAPIRATTRALAAMQTAINAVGLALFDGDLDRFGIFALIFSQTHPDALNGRPIAVNSLAMSVGRPFETVRRHVNALIGRGLCERVGKGISLAPAATTMPDVIAASDAAHHAFVRFVEELTAQALVPPLPKPVHAYHPIVGVDAAVNVLFAAVESNRLLHHDWTSLSVFSGVLLANAQRHEALAPLGGVPLSPAHAVRASVVARTLNLPETTVRRRVAILTAPGGPLIRCPRGLLVSSAWLADPAAEETSAATYTAIRRILARAAANGFPFHDPASAYLVAPAPLCSA